MMEYQDQVIDHLKKVFKEGKVDINSLNTILGSAMEKVESFDKLTSKVKKQIVLGSVQQFLDGGLEMDLCKEEIEFMAKSMLPPIIDLVVDASKGKLCINKVGKLTKWCCH